MTKLSKKQLLQIQGGTNISGTVLNAIARGIETMLDVGRSLGSAIRRWQGNQLCPI